MKKLSSADVVFAAQMFSHLLYACTQVPRMMQALQGVSLSMFLCVLGFFVFMVLLCAQAHRNQPSTVTLQALISCVTALVITSGCALLVGYHLVFTRQYTWSQNDTVTITLALSGSMIVGIWAYRTGYPLSDGLPRSGFAVCCKAIPQLLLAVKIAVVGSGGYAFGAILSSHLSIHLRLVQLWIIYKENRRDPNRIGMLAAEILGALTWYLTTVVWVYRHFNPL